MTRFSATTLDLSRLPVPAVIKDLDKDVILAERLESLKVRFEAAGIDYDVGVLETDPGVILQQEDTYRELLDKQAINDAAKAVLTPYATGTDLDALGIRFGVLRLEGEPDERFRHRIQLAPDAYSSAGTAGAYRYHAMSVALNILDVGIFTTSPGNVTVAVLSTEGDGAPSDVTVALVRNRLLGDDIRPLTDAVTVKAARIANYVVSFKLLVPDGPDPSLVIAAARSSLEMLIAERRVVGGTIHLSALAAAAHVANVLDVAVLAPAGDVEVAQDEAGYCTDIILASEVAQ